MRGSARQTRWDCLAIVVSAALPLLLLAPLQNTPFIDDWAYAWSVENLLRGGGLQRLDWSTHPNVVQILWGALFCLPGGFSFTALRASTWVLGASGLVALYLLLRQLEITRRDALLGTATLGINPIFFALSFTFMTDVPFLALATWASLAMILALARRSEAWLAAAALGACLASAVRAVGLVLPAAMVLTLLLAAGRWGRHPRRLLIAGLPLAVLAGLLWWSTVHVHAVMDLSQIKDSPVFRVRQLPYGVRLLPQTLFDAVGSSVNVLGLALLPLILAGCHRRQLRTSLAAAATLAVLLAAGRLVDARYDPPLVENAIWAVKELGTAESLVPAYAPIGRQPVTWILVPVVLLLGGQWVAALLKRRRLEPAEVFLGSMLVGHVLLVALLWLFYDRCMLPLLVPALALLLRLQPLHRPALALIALAAIASLSVVGMRDHLAYNRALWQGVGLLQRLGARDAEINAGYVINGWLHYAHPDNAPRGADGTPKVPWINGVKDEPLRYLVANQSAPGYETLYTIPYRRWLGRSGSIFVLERRRPGTLRGARENRPQARGSNARRALPTDDCRRATALAEPLALQQRAHDS